MDTAVKRYVSYLSTVKKTAPVPPSSRRFQNPPSTRMHVYKCVRLTVGQRGTRVVTGGRTCLGACTQKRERERLEGGEHVFRDRWGVLFFFTRSERVGARPHLASHILEEMWAFHSLSQMTTGVFIRSVGIRGTMTKWVWRRARAGCSLEQRQQQPPGRTSPLWYY